MKRLLLSSRFEFTGASLGLPFVRHSGFDSSHRRRLGLGEHVHSGHELTFVFEGEVTWETRDGERLTLRGGDLAVTQPNVPHWGRMRIIEPATFFWTNIELRRGAAGLLSTSELAHVRRGLSDAGNLVCGAGDSFATELIRLHDGLAKAAIPPDPLARAALRARYLAIVIDAALLLRTSARRSPDSAHSDATDLIEAAKVFVEQHSADPALAIASVARHTGLSQSRLYAAFRERTGMTPNDFLLRCRIRTAQRILRTTTTPVTRIALECGFASSQYFATCFRKYSGQTPREFRSGHERV